MVRAVPIEKTFPRLEPPAKYRIVLGAAIVGFFGVTFLLYAWGLRDVYAGLLRRMGVSPFTWPFVDAHAILAAVDCHRAGIDVTVVDPCDVLDRTFPYPPVWFDIVPRFATTAYTLPLAMAFLAAFLLGVLVVLRPRSRGELACCIAGALSSAVAFGVERANLDLVVFALAASVAWLYGGRRWSRACGYGAAFVAGALKFYPFVLLVLAIGEPRRRVVWIGAISSALAAYGLYYQAGISAALHSPAVTGPPIYFGNTIAARNLPFGLVALTRGAVSEKAAPWIYAALVLLALGLAAMIVRRIAASSERVDASAFDMRCLLVGSVLVGSCFFVGENVGYRAMHLLLLLPGLFVMRRAFRDPALHRGAVITIGVVLLVMWQAGIAHALDAVDRALPGRLSVVDMFWIVRECAWWWLVTVMLAVIGAFLLRPTLVEPDIDPATRQS